MRGRLGMVIGVIAVAAVGGLAWHLRGPSPPKAVFLVVVDTLRADRLSCYGYEGHETPHIDRLADRGVKFTRACSVASWTVPSMGAMLTSLYPTQLNLIERLAPPGKRFEPREKRQQRAYTLPLFPRTLPEILAEAGFRTVGFVDQPALNFGNGFLQGFADWFYPVGPDEIKYHDPRQPLVAQEWPSLKYADRSDMALIREFDGWLAVHAEQRLFVWFQLLTPHRPYKPAPKYMPQRDDEGDSEPTATELYEGEVRAVDDMIGEILASIDRYVGLKRSLVVFVSDHGEELGERGMKDHGHTLHREIIHVPLIIASPSLPAGETVDTYVRTIDILPSVLELVDRQLPAPVAMEGSSLVELTRDDARAHRPVFSEAMLYGSTERSLVHGAYKLMYDEQDEQYRLFNALSDPDETIDLGLQEPERRDAMRSTLWELHNGLRNEYLDRFGSQPVSPHSEEELQQALEALRALGYVDD